METHQIQKTVLPNGMIVIENLPFEVGEKVNIKIVKSEDVDPHNLYPLRGTPYRYDDPFSPLISLDDWEPMG